jgi:hypothetical protein
MKESVFNIWNHSLGKKMTKKKVAANCQHLPPIPETQSKYYVFRHWNFFKLSSYLNILNTWRKSNVKVRSFGELWILKCSFSVHQFCLPLPYRPVYWSQKLSALPFIRKKKATSLNLSPVQRAVVFTRCLHTVNKTHARMTFCFCPHVYTSYLQWRLTSLDKTWSCQENDNAIQLYASPVLYHINPVQTLPPCFFRNHFNIILPLPSSNLQVPYMYTWYVSRAPPI